MSNDSAAIMFSDVSGSSRLFKTVGDAQARSIISQVVEMMMQKTREAGGTVIKTIGDECMSSFPSSEDAMNACIEIQRDIDTTNYGAPLTIRIGFHFGPIIKEDGDIYGEAVNDAADLVKVAKGGQVITSHRTLLSLPLHLQEKLKRFDEIRIKGGKASEVIYLVDWEEDNQESNATQFMAVIDTAQFAKVEVPQGITLEYEGETINLTKDDMPFSIGRDASADLTVAFRMASRDHCKLDYRRGKFVLVDNSTNGTYVAPDGRSNLYLRREETPLVSTGTISFSPDYQMEGPHRLRYSAQ